MIAVLEERVLEMEEAAWFAGRLKELREARGWTQQVLAEKSGVSQRAISHIEQGRNEPGWSTIIALGKALGVSCDEFLKEPQPRDAAGPGRPKKADDEPEPEQPKRPRGRPRKEPAEDDAGEAADQVEPEPKKPRNRKT
jgi:transcriptional regulator with XRE-family HTH domain